MYTVHQRSDSKSITDVAAAVREQFAGFDFSDNVAAGQTVAVAVGSRGIHHLVTIVTTVVERLRTRGLQPFVIPGMGSHGGATAEGQATVLRELGITESVVGAPVVSGMDVVSLGRVNSGAEVFFAKDAVNADHLFVINRVKPHTAFRGEVESGLCKMLAVGCGRQKGASNMHKFGLGASIVPAAEMILDKASVLCGLTVVEDAANGIHSLELVPADDFIDSDKKNLQSAQMLLPKIPLADLDILVVDEMGKNISGAGLDPNVIGFWRREGGPRTPDYRTLIVLDLTPQSHGNATGIGMVDLTTRRMIDQIDMAATYTNAITAGVLRSVRLPIALENDRTVLETALNLVAETEKIKMVRIVNTLALQTFWATEAVFPELSENQNITIDDKAKQFEFDVDGRLLPF
jgi:hypothetical protein